MDFFCISRTTPLKGQVRFLGDKSIAHRALFLSALSKGVTRIFNFPLNNDCKETAFALRALGVKIHFEQKKNDSGCVTVLGQGLSGLTKPRSPIFIKESGTTLRLLLGVLAGFNFPVKIVAGPSLSRRPVRRVNLPLRLMGAKVVARQENIDGRLEEYPPVVIEGGRLKGIFYTLPVASAQVKSAILLAGLNASGKTRVREIYPTRDHTERMLKAFQARISSRANVITLEGKKELVSPGQIKIPGDFSSASFFIVAAALVAGSKIAIKDVGLNPTRLGLLRVLEKMGLRFKVIRSCLPFSFYEPIGDLIVEAGNLKGVRVRRAEIPLLIDELPILMVAASLAEGRSVFEGVGELRVKETDRIKSMSENLRKMGAKIKIINHARRQDIVIDGLRHLKGARVKSFGDHRTAMSMVVAGLLADGQTEIDNIDCIRKSFPSFLACLESLQTKG